MCLTKKRAAVYCGCRKGADRFIINLECALTNSENAILKCGPNNKADPRITNGLITSGVTDVLFANNRIFDFGTGGFFEALAAFEAAGLPYTEVCENDTDSRKIYYIDSGKGKRPVIVDVTEREYTYFLLLYKGNTPNKINAFCEFHTRIKIGKKFLKLCIDKLIFA